MTTENTVKLLKFAIEEITSIDSYGDLYQHFLALDVIKTSGYGSGDTESVINLYLQALKENKDEVRRRLSGNYNYIHNYFLTATGESLPTNVNHWFERLESTLHVIETFINDVTVLLYLENHHSERYQADDIITTMIRVILDHLGKRLKEINELINN